jgi:hypothetical protein
VLKVEVARIIKYDGDEPQFEMVLADGSAIMLGSIEGLINQRILRNTLAAHKGVIIKQVKGPAWDDYATLMLSMVEVRVPAHEDSTLKGSLEATITRYLEKNGVMDNAEHAFATERPFRKHGHVYMFSTAFRMWTKLNADPLSKKELALISSSLGIEVVKMKFNKGTEEYPHYTTRNVYDVTSFDSGNTEKERPGLYDVESGPEVEAVQ